MYQYFGKRTFDILASTLALILFSPLLAIVAILVRVRLGSPVLSRQSRPGLHGKPLCLIKFRTMTDTRDREGKLLPDAERLTTVGRLIRSTSLDELPELLNVVRGEMSLVGPRPLLTQYLHRYSAEQARRHEVRPGITGWAQVKGRNAVSWEKRLAMDVWYVEHRSLGLDLRILLQTFWKVLTRDGLNQPGHATMEEFHGSGGNRGSRAAS